MTQKQYKEGLKLTNPASFHGEFLRREGKKAESTASRDFQKSSVASVACERGQFRTRPTNKGQLYHHRLSLTNICCVTNFYPSNPCFHPHVKIHWSRYSRGGRAPEPGGHEDLQWEICPQRCNLSTGFEVLGEAAEHQKVAALTKEMSREDELK